MSSYSKQALDELENGHLEQYHAQFQKALKNDDDDLLFSLAEELYSLGFNHDTAQIYEQLLTKYPNEDELKINLAEVLISDGQDDKALNLVSEVPETSPNYVQALMVAADLYQTQGLLDVSKQKLLLAQQLAPDENVITFALAELLFTMREFAKAIPLYLSLIKQGIPQFSSVNLVERIGVAYANDGRFEHAIGYLKQIKLIDMTPDVKFETAFTYLQLGDYKEAIKLFNSLRETNRDYSTLYPYLGEALIHENQDEQALRVFQEGLSVDQYNEQLWLKAADLSAQLQDFPDAEHDYLTAVELAPDDVEVLLKASNFYLQQRRDEDNVKLITDSHQIDALDPQLMWNLALSYSRLDQVDLAQKYYQAALPNLDNDAGFLKDAGIFFRSIGDVHQAKQLLTKYLQMVPTDNEIEEILSTID